MEIDPKYAGLYSPSLGGIHGEGEALLDSDGPHIQKHRQKPGCTSAKWRSGGRGDNYSDGHSDTHSGGTRLVWLVREERINL